MTQTVAKSQCIIFFAFFFWNILYFWPLLSRSTLTNHVFLFPSKMYIQTRYDSKFECSTIYLAALATNSINTYLLIYFRSWNRCLGSTRLYNYSTCMDRVATWRMHCSDTTEVHDVLSRVSMQFSCRGRYCFSSSVRPSVCLSVYMSNAGTVSKRIDISSHFLVFTLW